MAVDGFWVGVDFGTSSTAAVLAGPETLVRPLLFDGSPLLPSAVFAGAAGDLLTGRDAVHTARTQPERFEPTPKRCVDDDTVLLGDRAVPVVELIAAVLSRVAAEATVVAGQPVRRAVLTHPASWGPLRQATLLAAAFPEPTLVPEPVAAASYFLTVAGGQLPPGSSAMVYDLGAGTFDASPHQSWRKPSQRSPTPRRRRPLLPRAATRHRPCPWRPALPSARGGRCGSRSGPPSPS